MSSASDRLRPEAIEESLHGIKSQLNFLQNEGSKITSDIHGERDRANRIQTRVEKLGVEFNTLSQSFVELSEKANETKHERQKIDEEFTNLLQEKIRLLEEEKLTRAQLQTLDVESKLSKEGKNLQDFDLENERKLLEFAKEDLAKKKEDIDSLQRRLEEKYMERDNEWEGFKDDIRRAREEKRPYLKNLQELDNLVMSRFRGILRFAPEAVNDEEREQIEMTIQNLEIKKEIKEEREKLLEMELQARDLHNCLSCKMVQRKALWRQFDSIQENRSQLLSTEEASFRIRRAESMDNLLANPTEIRDQLVFECGDNELLLGGKSLHRCHKNMNISIPLTDAERHELETMLQEGAEVSDNEDVDVEQETIERQINLEQDVQNEDKSDLGATGPSYILNPQSPGNKEKHKDKTEQEEEGRKTIDVAKNLLRQAEGNISNPNLLLSKIQNKLIGPANKSAADIAATGGGGSRMPFTFQRLKSDSSYKVDASFKRNKRH